VFRFWRFYYDGAAAWFVGRDHNRPEERQKEKQQSKEQGKGRET
jgi:hypothetical protein